MIMTGSSSFYQKLSRPIKIYCWSAGTILYIKVFTCSSLTSSSKILASNQILRLVCRCFLIYKGTLVAHHSILCSKLFRPIKFHFSYAPFLTFINVIYCSQLRYEADNHILKYLTYPCKNSLHLRKFSLSLKL